MYYCSLQLIGWKPQRKARRIVLLVTDALPKIAGDGQVTRSFVFFLLFYKLNYFRRENIFLFLIEGACA